MSFRASACFAFVLFACGSSPAPSSSTAPATAASAAPSSKEAGSPADDDRCLASIARRRPALSGWTEVGQLVIETQDGQPTSFEARDASGKSVEKKPAPKERKEAREVMLKLACRLGGLVAAFDGKEPSMNGTATATMTVLRPSAPDEKADVAMLCKEPADMPGADHALDEQHTVRIAVDFFDERLTTKKWRAWLFDAAGRKEQAADELSAAARTASIAPCWFADGLRHH